MERNNLATTLAACRPASSGKLSCNGAARHAPSLEVAKANFERIVATWNAADGVPVAALPPGILREALQVLRMLEVQLAYDHPPDVEMRKIMHASVLRVLDMTIGPRGASAAG